MGERVISVIEVVDRRGEAFLGVRGRGVGVGRQGGGRKWGGRISIAYTGVVCFIRCQIRVLRIQVTQSGVLIEGK